MTTLNLQQINQILAQYGIPAIGAGDATLSEFCQLYAISRTSFYKEIWADRLRIIKRGRATLITRTEAERWFTTLCQQSQPPQSA